jgi:hypothetical protein
MENKHTQYVDFSNPNADKITTGTTNKPMNDGISEEKMKKEIKKGNLNFDQSGRAYPDNPEVKENWDCIWEKDGKHYKLVGDDEHREWEEVRPSNETLYSEIEHLIIRWTIDGTKTAGSLTRDIMKLIKSKDEN